MSDKRETNLLKKGYFLVTSSLEMMSSPFESQLRNFPAAPLAFPKSYHIQRNISTRASFLKEFSPLIFAFGNAHVQNNKQFAAELYTKRNFLTQFHLSINYRMSELI